MPLEIEQKFPVDEPAALLAKLAELGVVLGEPMEQRDTYFQHPARDFRQTDEAFRIRQIGDENFMTYKGPKLDAATKTRREIEIRFASGCESAAQLAAMWQLLGFRVGGVVTKLRRSGHLRQDAYEVQIAWDEVADLGVFMELELLADESHLAAGRSALAAVATQLGLARSERRSYLELLGVKS